MYVDTNFEAPDFRMRGDCCILGVRSPANVSDVRHSRGSYWRIDRISMGEQIRSLRSVVRLLLSWGDPSAIPGRGIDSNFRRLWLRPIPSSVFEAQNVILILGIDGSGSRLPLFARSPRRLWKYEQSLEGTSDANSGASRVWTSGAHTHVSCSSPFDVYRFFGTCSGLDDEWQPRDIDRGRGSY